MNEFLLLAVVIIYLAIKPPPQGTDEEVTSSRIQKKSGEAFGSIRSRPVEARVVSRQSGRKVTSLYPTG
jgi:hypothetical protein